MADKAISLEQVVELYRRHCAQDIACVWAKNDQLWITFPAEGHMAKNALSDRLRSGGRDQGPPAMRLRQRQDRGRLDSADESVQDSSDSDFVPRVAKRSRSPSPSSRRSRKMRRVDVAQSTLREMETAVRQLPFSVLHAIFLKAEDSQDVEALRNAVLQRITANARRAPGSFIVPNARVLVAKAEEEAIATTSLLRYLAQLERTVMSLASRVDREAGDLATNATWWPLAALRMTESLRAPILDSDVGYVAAFLAHFGITRGLRMRADDILGAAAASSADILEMILEHDHEQPLDLSDELGAELVLEAVRGGNWESIDVLLQWRMGTRRLDLRARGNALMRSSLGDSRLEALRRLLAWTGDQGVFLDPRQDRNFLLREACALEMRLGTCVQTIRYLLFEYEHDLALDDALPGLSEVQQSNKDAQRDARALLRFLAGTTPQSLSKARIDPRLGSDEMLVSLAKAMNHTALKYLLDWRGANDAFVDPRENASEGLRAALAWGRARNVETLTRWTGPDGQQIDLSFNNYLPYRLHHSNRPLQEQHPQVFAAISRLLDRAAPPGMSSRPESNGPSPGELMSVVEEGRAIGGAPKIDWPLLERATNTVPYPPSRKQRNNAEDEANGGFSQPDNEDGDDGDNGGGDDDDGDGDGNVVTLNTTRPLLT